MEIKSSPSTAPPKKGEFRKNGGPDVISRLEHYRLTLSRRRRRLEKRRELVRERDRKNLFLAEAERRQSGGKREKQKVVRYKVKKEEKINETKR